MTRTTLSSFRTALWGRVVFVFVAVVGSIPLGTIVFAPSRFSWNGGPAPWYVPFFMLGLLAFVLGMFWFVLGSLAPVSVDEHRLYVRGWVALASYPLESIREVWVDRRTRIMGENPIRIEVEVSGETRRVAFLIADRLDHDDLERLLGKRVNDEEDEPAEEEGIES